MDFPLASALEYLKDILNDKEKGCITFCGYSLYQVQHIGKNLGVPVLDGTQEIGTDKIYLSDLDQTKGFEFDRMIIINANERVIPDYSLPEDEWYREISKFYVAMTRAKKELIVSFSSKHSKLFDSVKEYFTEDIWTDHIVPLELEIELPQLAEYRLSKVQAAKMSGKEFLYHKNSLGISRELQNKLIEHVAGKSVSLGNKKVGWTSIEDLKNDIASKRNIPHLSDLFGPTVYKELDVLFYK